MHSAPLTTLILALKRQKYRFSMITLSDVLAATKPPLELLDHLTRYQGRAALPDVVATWAERWRRIYAGDPDPLLDELQCAAGAETPANTQKEG